MGVENQSQLPHRPRCPTCYAMVGMLVVGASGFVDGSVRVSVRCSYLRRDAGRRSPCNQPVVLVLRGSEQLYTFPPDWDTANSLTADELVERYGRR